MKVKEFKIKFDDTFPEDIEQGVLYISMKYKTSIHRCPCGCGEKVVLPILPDRWHMYTDGKEVTLTPSVGNFSYPCKSHYFIRNNKVEWVENEPKPSKRKNKKKKKRKFLFFNW